MNVRRKVWVGLVGTGVLATALFQFSAARPAGAQAGGDVSIQAAADDGVVDKNGQPARGLTTAERRRILNQALAAAARTISGLRGVDGNADGDTGDAGESRFTRMHIALVSRSGRFLSIRSMPDAWEGSLDIAIGKARTAAFFSSNENALTSRVIGELSQAHDPHPDGPRTGEGAAGPLWGIWVSNQPGISGNAQTRNGLIPFPGGVPLYRNGILIGGIGVSGDGVDQDEAVALAGAAGFLPPTNIAQLGF